MSRLPTVGEFAEYLRQQEVAELKARLAEVQRIVFETTGHPGDDSEQWEHDIARATDLERKDWKRT